MHVLVASATAALSERLARALSERHQLETVAPARLLERLARGGCDLVIIEDDAALCEKVRAAHRALPMLAVTAADDVEARVRALESGADDVMAEPWARSQMAARVGALGRRAALVPEQPRTVEADGCTIDLAKARALRAGREIKLTAREVSIIAWLMRHGGRAVSRDELLEHVWEVAPGLETRSVDVAIAALRKKIERDPSSPALVVSVLGLGYAWGPSLT
jgi:DNA-binding response OmpR family regulator